MIGNQVFKCSELDLLAYLRFKGFEPIGCPIEDEMGTRWVRFSKTAEIESAIVDFSQGNNESRLLKELRKARCFLLDSPRKQN